jgi:phage terminase large subunit
VYTFGRWGVLGHVIFTNWRVEDLAGMRAQFTNRRTGLDFGFSSDPAASTRTHYDRKRKTIYIFDELYETGLTNDQLAKSLKELLCSEYAAGDGVTASKDDYRLHKDELTQQHGPFEPVDYGDAIVADSSEPKSIKELQGYGLNVVGAKKGLDSVLFGIQWLQQQEIVIDSACVNARNEFMQYHWKEDRDGNAIRQPADKNNHIIDQLRYAYEQDALEPVTTVPNPFYD